VPLSYLLVLSISTLQEEINIGCQLCGTTSAQYQQHICSLDFYLSCKYYNLALWFTANCLEGTIYQFCSSEHVYCL